MPRDSKVAILKDSLAAIGRRIDYVLETKRANGEDVDRWKRHLWTWVYDSTYYARRSINTCRCRFVTLFWPKQVKASKLEEIHAKMVMKEGAPRQSSTAVKPRPTTSVKTNGSIPSSSSTPIVSSSSHRMNGNKPHRWNSATISAELHTHSFPSGFLSYVRGLRSFRSCVIAFSFFCFCSLSSCLFILVVSSGESLMPLISAILFLPLICP